MQTFNDFVEEVRALETGTERSYPKLLNSYALLIWFKDPESGGEIQKIAQVINVADDSFTIRRL